MHGLEAVNALGGFAGADDEQASGHWVQCPGMPDLHHQITPHNEMLSMAGLGYETG